MQAKTIVDWVDRIRPNNLDLVDKLNFVGEINTKVLIDIQHKEQSSLPMYESTELAAPYSFCGLYRWYVAAMVSAAAGNNEVYLCDMAVFRESWNEYAAWYLREGRR